MELKQAIEHALNNEAILFLGSGASVGATNQNGTDYKVGTGLTRLICDEIGIKESKSLQLAVEHYLDIKAEDGLDNEQELINLLKKEFISAQIAEHHKQYPDVPWKRIYTTNYDDIVEKSYCLAGKNIVSYTLNEKRRGSGDDVEYIHINGSIKNLNKNTLNKQFKLSDVSYTSESFESDSWGKLFVQDMKTYSAVIFIGFSLEYDLDLKRLIYSATAYQDKCIFIVWDKEEDDNLRILSKYGKVFKIGCNGFFEEVIKVKSSYLPKCCATLENTVLSNFHFIKVKNDKFSQSASDSQVFAYYTTGERTPDLYYPKGNGFESVVIRNNVNIILKEIEVKKIEAIFLHSDIGNGKSEIIEQIILLAPAKYNLFLLQDYNEKIHKEIEMICNSNKRSIVIIENFFNYKDVIDLFKLHNTNKNIHLILTSRTSIYKHQYESFIEGFTTSVHDANRLDDNEINELVRIFDNYGYYLSNDIDNQTFIVNECKKKIQSVMLQLFKHKGINNELQKAINSINNNELKEQYVDFIVYLLIIKIMSFDLDFYDIVHLCNDHAIDISFEKNQHINEFIDIRGKKTKIKSSALAIWLINQISIKNKVFVLLHKIAVKANQNYKINKKSEILLRNVVSFKHLRFLLDLLELPQSDKNTLVYEFYENIKNLEYYKDRYFFWLQYAIAAIELNDLDMAEMHFKAAYVKCPTTPFEIDNHYARLKIERLLLPETQYSPNTIIQLEEINKLLTPSLAEEDDEFYCYKMANSYYRMIFNKYFSLMTLDEQNQLKSFACNNFNLCKKFKMYNKNSDFHQTLTKFEKEFLSLAHYIDSRSTTKGKVIFVLEYFVKIEFSKEGNKVEGQLRLTDTKRKKFKIGESVTVSVKHFNKKRNCWELSLVE